MAVPGGTVGHTERAVWPSSSPRRERGEPHLGGTAEQRTVWMSHRDAVSEVQRALPVTASTDVYPLIAAMENAATRTCYSTQFHPEVNHRSAEVASRYLTSCSISVV